MTQRNAKEIAQQIENDRYQQLLEINGDPANNRIYTLVEGDPKKGRRAIRLNSDDGTILNEYRYEGETKRN